MEWSTRATRYAAALTEPNTGADRLGAFIRAEILGPDARSTEMPRPILFSSRARHLRAAAYELLGIADALEHGA